MVHTVLMLTFVHRGCEKERRCSGKVYGFKGIVSLDYSLPAWLHLIPYTASLYSLRVDA